MSRSVLDPGPRHPGLRRLAVLVLALALFVLLSEGVLSFFLGRSWRELGRRRSFLESIAPPNVQTDADRLRAAAQTPGPYRVHEDPLVSYSFKASTKVTYIDREIQTDELGLRARPGPAPGAAAFRILFLGDSVAFGQGLGDQEVLAVQVEELLRAARAPGAREIACFTVAVPGWNYRNALRFLVDHLDRLDPDLVLYMDVPNDLDDSYGVNEAGQRCTLEDPGAPHPRLTFRPEYTYLAFAAKTLRAAGKTVDEERCGPDVTVAGLSLSSSWRLSDMVALLAHTQERLDRIGARLALLPYEQHALHRQVRARLAARGTRIPAIPLLEKLEKPDTQGDDPHPSAATARAFALWTAASLLESQWVPGALVVPLPDVDGRYAGRRAHELPEAELSAWSDGYQRSVAEDLEPRLSSASLQGMRQLHGGLNLDGTFGVELAAVLPAGNRLSVELGPLEARPDLYPLAVRVHVNEQELGTVVIPSAAAAVNQTFDLPDEAAHAPFEVRLEALDWCIVTIRGQSLIASARFLELASLAE